MGAGRQRNYNPRTGTWTRPKPWYDKGGKRKKRRKKNGCFVATTVYGSYDCPEVWTLRRYRDNYLAKKFLGRMFVKIYYSTSPTLVRLVGKTKWFNKLFRSKLDKMIKKLNNQGYSSDKYEDIDW